MVAPKQNRGGRPPSSNPRIATLGVRLTPQEYASAIVEAERRGISVGELLRTAIPSPEGIARGDASGPGVTRRA